MQDLLSRQTTLMIKTKRKMMMMMMMRIFLSTSWILMRRLEVLCSRCCSYAIENARSSQNWIGPIQYFSAE